MLEQMNYDIRHIDCHNVLDIIETYSAYGIPTRKETEMNKHVYTAYVINNSGAGEDAGRDTNLNALKASIRRRYGAGWTVVISKIEADEGGGWFPAVEVARFTLRK